MQIGPIAELVAKAAPDLVLRNFGMDEMADRIAPTLPGGIDKALEGMPQDAQNIVKGFMQQLNAANQHIQQLELEQKYGMAKTHMQSVTKAHDTETDAQVKEADSKRWAAVDIERAHIDRRTKLDVAEIGAEGRLLDTHVKGKQAQEMEKIASKDEKSP